MQDIEVLIWKVLEKHPEWLAEAEEIGADQHLSSMVQFLIAKLEQVLSTAPQWQIVVKEAR